MLTLGQKHMGHWTRLGLGTLAALSIAGFTSVANAQTWPGGQTGPALGQLFAIDKTGETGWVYGAEDVAGDGLDQFKQQEMSIDIRTAYASTDAQRFWARVYVSDAASPGGNINAYVFIDSDRSASTGGSSAATDIDPKLTSNPTGGFEFVLGVQGNQTLQLWEWNGSAWAKKNLDPSQGTAEAGAILDPIRLNGDVHGYLQGAVDLNQVALTQACEANLYVRTTGAASVGAGDLEVGVVGPCIPADGNGNGVPDPVENPPSGCTSDAQCANGGVCLNGKCIFAAACSVPADCQTGYVCTNGRCVLQPSGTCTTNAECNGAVCTGGQCVACAPGGTECGSGYVCGPDGRCISSSGGGGAGGSGVVPGPDDEIQGGACACSTPGGAGSRAFTLSLLFPLLFAARRAARRSSSSR